MRLIEPLSQELPQCADEYSVGLQLRVLSELRIVLGLNPTGDGSPSAEPSRERRVGGVTERLSAPAEPTLATLVLRVSLLRGKSEPAFAFAEDSSKVSLASPAIISGPRSAEGKGNAPAADALCPPSAAAWSLISCCDIVGA